MTQPRRQDELDLYAALRQAAEDYSRSHPDKPFGYWGGGSVAFRIHKELGIPEGRAFYLLIKWTGKGWIEYGMWAWGGWFTADAPEQLEP